MYKTKMLNTSRTVSVAYYPLNESDPKLESSVQMSKEADHRPLVSGWALKLRGSGGKSRKLKSFMELSAAQSGRSWIKLSAELMRLWLLSGVMEWRTASSDSVRKS